MNTARYLPTVRYRYLLHKINDLLGSEGATLFCYAVALMASLEGRGGHMGRAGQVDCRRYFTPIVSMVGGIWVGLDRLTAGGILLL